MILVHPKDVIISPSDPRRPALQLSHLELWLDHDVPPDLFNFILLPSRSTLSSLMIKDLSPLNLVRTTAFFASHPFPLRTLVLRGLKASSAFTALLPHLPTLHCIIVEEFVYIGFRPEPGLQDAIIEDIAESVAPTLEELAVDGTRALRWTVVVDLVPLLAALRRALGSPRLGNLKRLGLSEWEEAELREAVGGEELLDECLRKGVRVVLKDGVV